MGSFSSAHAMDSQQLRAEDSAGRGCRHQINERLWLRLVQRGSRCPHVPIAFALHSIENFDTRLVALVAYMEVPCALCVKTTCGRASGHQVCST